MLIVSRHLMNFRCSASVHLLSYGIADSEDASVLLRMLLCRLSNLLSRSSILSCLRMICWRLSMIFSSAFSWTLSLIDCESVLGSWAGCSY